jgi:hypothetical protein
MTLSQKLWDLNHALGCFPLGTVPYALSLTPEVCNA